MTAPAVYFLSAYSLGIIAADHLCISFQYLLIVTIIYAIFCYYHVMNKARPFKMILVLIFITGVLSYKYATLPPPRSDISYYADNRYVTVSGLIIDEPLIADGKTSFTLRVKGMHMFHDKFKVSGKVKIYLLQGIPSLQYGYKIQIKGLLSKLSKTNNFNILSYAQLMDKRGIYSQLYGEAGSLRILDINSGSPIVKLTTSIKNRLLASLKRTLNEPYASLLGSIIFGSAASPLPDNIQEDYRNAGVVHLLVVSGTQVSILLGVTASILKGMGIPSVVRVIIASVFNFIFVIMVGAGPSIVRAAIMGEMALFANIFQRDNDFYNTVAISAIMILVFNPLILFDVGFQLSFLATWALFYIAPAIEAKLSTKFPPFISNLFAISIAPTLATTPISFYNFGQISFVSIIANMAIIPWIEIIVVLGFASTLIGTILMPISMVINNFLFIVLAVLNSMVSFFSHLPFAYRFIVPPTLPIILCYYIIIIGGIEMLKGNIKLKLNKEKAVVIFLTLLSVFVWHIAASAVPVNSAILKDELVITVIDVGQGDSVLVESPGGKTMLIDGGGKYQANKKESIGNKIVIPYLRKQGINGLDVVVLTHPHDDHVGGLVSVLEKMPVKLIIDSGKPHTSFSYINFLKLVQKKNIKYELGRSGQVIDLGGKVKAYILHPTDRFMKSSDPDLNNSSVVIRLVYKDFSVLLVGDLGYEGEKYLLKQGVDLKSDVLKIGHHGSKTSTSAEFLKAVSPRYAIISVGSRNKFGHPSKITLDELNRSAVRTYRTDRDGAVRIRTDGEKVIVETKNGNGT